MRQRDDTQGVQPATELRREQNQRRALGVLYAALTALAVWVLHDFIAAIVWAGVFAIALWPVLLRLEQLPGLRGRRSRLSAKLGSGHGAGHGAGHSAGHGAGHSSIPAALLTLAVALLFVLPLGLAANQVIHEAHGVLEWFRNAQANGIPLPAFVDRLPRGGAQVSAWWQQNLSAPLRSSSVGRAMHSDSVFAFSRQFGVRALHTVVLFGFMLLTLFFVLRAGSQLTAQLVNGARRSFGADGALLATRMAASVRGTVTGLVVVGIGEGALLGVGYLIAGVPHAALLGTVTALAAMLPFCAPIVFTGAALWLLVQGSTAAAAVLLAAGFVIVFVAEHFVRPVLIGGAARLPFMLVLLGILGGAETFGLLGIFIGPAIMTVLMILWTEWAR